MEIDEHSLIDNFRCPICWEIVEEPWESSCCGYLFCEKCKQSCSKEKCPMCREKNFKYRSFLEIFLELNIIIANFVGEKRRIYCPHQ